VSALVLAAQRLGTEAAGGLLGADGQLAAGGLVAIA
jgi:hypothetical protein